MRDYIKNKDRIPIKYVIICIVSTLISAFMLGLGIDIQSVALGITGFIGLCIFIALGITLSIICYTIWKKQ